MAALRIMGTCLPGYGHFLPMLALGRAIADAGHEIAFATAAEFCPKIEKAGFRAFPAGLSLPEQLEQAARRFPEQHAMPPSKERFEAFVPRMLAGVAAPARADDLVPIVEDWRPDVLVHDETDFGGPVAAAAAGVPYADHSVGILRPFPMARLAREVLAPLWRRHGVDLGEFGGLFGYLYLDVCPPRLQSPAIAAVDVAHQMCNARLDPGDADLPPWVDHLGSAPTVYVSLGTIFNANPGVFAAILDGLKDEGVNVVVTVGADADPAALGPQPDHVHVERFIPQAALLPHCDVVVNQGGTAIYEILAHGLPLLVLPQGANQFHNAAALLDAGVARRLLPEEVDAEAVRGEVRALLDEPGYRRRARQVAGELARMPGPEQAVGLLERLARERTPLPGAGRRP